MPRRKKQVTEAPQLEQERTETDILTALGLPGDQSVREPQEKVPAKAQEPSVSDLLAQISALNSRLDLAERGNMALTTQVDTKLPTPPQAVSYKDLPDPVTDAEGYGRELHARIQKNMQETAEFERQQRQGQQAQNNQYDVLWEDFAIAYPDIAADEEGVEVIAAKVAKQAQKRGIDPNRYMFQHRDRFMADVAKAYRDIFPKDAENTPVNPRNPAEDQQPDHRTAGILGGQESGGGPAKGAEPKGGLVEDLHAVQRATGFY